MGAGGPGNFDNDCAMDFVIEFAQQLEKEATPPPACAEDIDLIMAAVAMLSALVSECHAYIEDKEAMYRLRDAVLAVYDAEIDGLEPTVRYKKERRKVIEDTFRTFLKRIER